jgi:crotonobetainyl-CoA:carnitine CoA-transferase CaiB-like acyl-CoA transferase
MSSSAICCGPSPRVDEGVMMFSASGRLMTTGRSTESPGALAGLRVVELGHDIAAAYCTKLFVDLGAAVIKIEPPGGDPLRAWGPFAPPCSRPLPRGKAAPPQGDEKPADTARGGGLFQYLNAGKQSVVLDLDQAAACQRFCALAREADILVENLPPGTLAGWQLGFATLRAVNPRLALVRITPFGQSGPYRDWPATSLVLQAAGGWVARLGTPGRPPVHVGGRIEEYTAGAYAAAAALTAWREAQRTGSAVEVDVSIFECLVGTLPFPMLQKVLFDKLGYPMPARYQAIPGILRCRDGYVGVSALTGQHWQDICQLIEAPEFAGQMREMQLRGAEWDAFLAKAQPWLDERTADEIVEFFQTARVPAVPIGDGRTLLESKQLRARGFYVPQPEGGFVRPTSPLRVGGTRPAPRPAPRLGEHTRTLPPWRDKAAPSPLTKGGPEGGAMTSAARRTWGGGRPDLPFSGVQVLDLSSFWAGSTATLYLATLGADVIKVESTRRPDGFRFVVAMPQLGERWYEWGVFFHGANLGKRGLTLDLTRAEGRALLARLLADTDVLVENFSPRVIEEFGFGYDAVREINPALIMVRMPGFGLSGPWRDYVGWALTFEQMGGCAAVTGDPDGPPLVPGGFADPVAGMHAVVAIQAALAQRAATGTGPLVEVAQVEVVAAMTAEQVIRYSMNAELLTRTGNRAAHLAPQGMYPCAGEDEWVALSVRDDADWKRLRGVLGEPAWAARPILDRRAGRREHHDEIDRHLATWTRPQAAPAVAQRLRDAGLPAAAMLKTGGMYGEPQLEARQYFQELHHPVAGALRFPVWPIRFSFGPTPPYAGPAPTLGQHNEEILGAVLGLASEQIAALGTAGIIGERMNG